MPRDWAALLWLSTRRARLLEGLPKLRGVSGTTNQWDTGGREGLHCPLLLASGLSPP